MNVLVFARLREIIGSGSVDLDVKNSPTAKSLRSTLAERYPEAEVLLAKCLVAVNNEYVGEEHLINPTDSVALIPPVSGG